MTRRARPAQQGALLESLRTHDLPPLWDGHRVEWTPWQTVGRTTYEWHTGDFVTCEYCGSVAPSLLSWGTVWAKPIGLLAFPQRRAWDSYQVRPGGEHAVAWLTVQRCPDCRTDEVWDRMADHRWMLDDTDYTDEGSWSQ